MRGTKSDVPDVTAHGARGSLSQLTSRSRSPGMATRMTTRTGPLDRRDWLAAEFERQRPHLRAVGYRMLGSMTEADDAVQEAWVRLDRRDPGRRRPARLAHRRGRADLPRRAPIAPGTPRAVRRKLAPGTGRDGRLRWRSGDGPGSGRLGRTRTPRGPRDAVAGRADRVRSPRRVRRSIRGGRRSGRPLTGGGASACQPRPATSARGRPTTGRGPRRPTQCRRRVPHRGAIRRPGRLAAGARSGRRAADGWRGSRATGASTGGGRGRGHAPGASLRHPVRGSCPGWSRSTADRAPFSTHRVNRRSWRPSPSPAAASWPSTSSRIRPSSALSSADPCALSDRAGSGVPAETEPMDLRLERSFDRMGLGPGHDEPMEFRRGGRSSLGDGRGVRPSVEGPACRTAEAWQHG